MYAWTEVQPTIPFPFGWDRMTHGLVRKFYWAGTRNMPVDGLTKTERYYTMLATIVDTKRLTKL